MKRREAKEMIGTMDLGGSVARKSRDERRKWKIKMRRRHDRRVMEMIN